MRMQIQIHSHNSSFWKQSKYEFSLCLCFKINILHLQLSKNCFTLSNEDGSTKSIHLFNIMHIKRMQVAPEVCVWSILTSALNKYFECMYVKKVIMVDIDMCGLWKKWIYLMATVNSSRDWGAKKGLVLGFSVIMRQTRFGM